MSTFSSPQAVSLLSLSSIGCDLDCPARDRGIRCLHISPAWCQMTLGCSTSVRQGRRDSDVIPTGKVRRRYSYPSGFFYLQMAELFRTVVHRVGCLQYILAAKVVGCLSETGRRHQLVTCDSEAPSTRWSAPEESMTQLLFICA